MENETLKDKAESLEAEFDTLRVLADTVDSRLGFFVSEKELLGPHYNLIKANILDIQVLLHVMNNYSWEMEKMSGDILTMIVEDVKCPS